MMRGYRAAGANEGGMRDMSGMGGGMGAAPGAGAGGGLAK